MRNILAFVAAALLAFFGVGWYLGWYKVHPVATDPGHRSYTIDIDSKKIGSDVVNYGQKVQDFIEKEEEAAGAAEKKSSAPAVQPLVDPRRGSTEEAEPKSVPNPRR